jgi:hypothetical protein
VRQDEIRVSEQAARTRLSEDARDVPYEGRACGPEVRMPAQGGSHEPTGRRCHTGRRGTVWSEVEMVTHGHPGRGGPREEPTHARTVYPFLHTFIHIEVPLSRVAAQGACLG